MTNYIRASSFRIIPCDIDQFFNVHTIYFHKSNFKSLPDEFFNLNLTILDLYQSQIRIIPRKIKKFVNLTFFNIYGCGLESLPSEILNLKKLNNGLLDGNKYPDTSEYGGIQNRLNILFQKGFMY